VLQYLADKGYGLHLITNGFEETQHSKLKHSNLSHFFQNVITSEGSNSLKPQPEIFHYALQKAGTKAEESIMIGDNLEVDIEGALNVGMDAVHVDFINSAPQPIKPTYTVKCLKELKTFL
jgi:putative hydrolase of the HAD superfamily